MKKILLIRNNFLHKNFRTYGCRKKQILLLVEKVNIKI